MPREWKEETSPDVEVAQGSGGDDAEVALAQVLPLWSEQIKTARSQTEEAINALAARFSKLVERLQTAVSAARQASGMAGQLESGVPDTSGAVPAQDVNAIISIMQHALEENREVVKQVSGLVVVTRELEGMIEVVKDVARQTDLIALNAAIEAARAGEAGKAFAVVAGEVRRLSQESRRAGQMIGDKISAIGETVTKSSEQIRSSAATIESALLRMSGMTQASVILEEESVGIQKEVSDMLVSLQFQDRVSQILAAVVSHQDELQGVFVERSEMSPEERPPLDIEACLESMARRYTTEEQRQMHRGDSESSAEGSGDADDLTFF